MFRSVRAAVTLIHNKGLFVRSFSTASASTMDQFKTIKVTNKGDFVYQVELNRPEKRNAMSLAMWGEVESCFNALNLESDCRVVVLTGAGKAFCAGIDLQDFASLASQLEEAEIPRKSFNMYHKIRQFQNAFHSIEQCSRPVIAAVHGPAVGAAVNMLSACDIRYCSQDATFQIKEVDIGIAADVGALQWFPKVVGNDSLTRELVYTARPFYADEAKAIGFVSRVFPDKATMYEAAFTLAVTIAEKSPVAVQGSKINLVYSRDHSVEEGLKYIARLNSTMLQSEDVMKAAMASMQKTKATFSKL